VEEMKSLEAQLWEQALHEERQRVDKMHEEAKARGGKSTVTFEPRNVPKPWSWENNWKVSLHDIKTSLVMAVSKFDFDLGNKEFEEFLRGRALLHLAGAPRSHYWRALNQSHTNESTFLSDRNLCYAQKHEGKRHRYSEQEMQTRWRIFQFGRVMLQAAWDVYIERERPKSVESVL